MFCQSCGTENTNDAQVCIKCGQNLIPANAPDPKHPPFIAPDNKPKSKAPIVIISCAVVAAIFVVLAIIAAIAIPSLLNSRKNPNETTALATCGYFSGAAAYFALNNDNLFWENGTEDFGDFANFPQTPGGYNFSYFSNSSSGDNATRFIYLAVPVSWSTGKKAYCVVESGQYYQLDFLNPIDLANFKIQESDIDWEAGNDAQSNNRLPDAEKWIRIDLDFFGQARR